MQRTGHIKKSTSASFKLKMGNIPSIDKISAVADYFGCSVDYLIGRTDTRVVAQIPDDLLESINISYNRKWREERKKLLNEIKNLNTEIQKLISED